MKHTEEKFEKYADELANALSTDLNKACKILTEIFRWTYVGEAFEFFDKITECVENASLLDNCFGSCTNLILKGTRSFDCDAYMRIKDIMETLHYDNGLPLSGYNYPEENPTEWNDYFDHYDRDQDFWGFYWDYPIYSFVTDGKDIYMKIDCSLTELRNILTEYYDGVSWEHDFDQR